MKSPFFPRGRFFWSGGTADPALAPGGGLTAKLPQPFATWLNRAMRTEYFRERRDRLRGGPPRTPQPCGTYAAAKRHQRNSEPLCDACRQAISEKNAEQYRKRKARTAG